MSIRSVEVICRPCPKCQNLEAVIRQIIKGMELTYKVKIPFEFKHTVALQELSKYSLNAIQTPAVLINGVVECAGQQDSLALKKRLETIHRMG